MGRDSQHSPAAAEDGSGGKVAVDPLSFRDVMSRFATGVTVVTVRGRSGPTGLTVNSLTSVSLDPPLVLVCLGAGSATHGEILREGAFAVNILNADQRALADTFAVGHREERFEGLDFRVEATGSPVFSAALAWLDCELWSTHEAGDHTIVVGEVRAAGAGADAEALLFFRGRYGRVG